MKLKPVKNYKTPDYPASSGIDPNSDLLNFVPKRWQNKSIVMATLTGATALISACSGNTTNTTEQTTVENKQITTEQSVENKHISSNTTEQTTNASNNEESTTKIDVNSTNNEVSEATKVVKNVPANVSKIAPVFEHGDGRGSFGCVAINPPVFLSEDEAKQIIIEEAKRAGINFAPDNNVIKSVQVPVTDQFAFTKQSQKQTTQKLPLKLDGMDPNLKIGFEYVSNSDFTDWESKNHTIWASVSSYDIIDAAKILRDGLEKASPNGYYAVFYDPLASPPPLSNSSKGPVDWRKQQEQAKGLAKQNLKKQVNDFIEWLRNQGAL